MQQKDTQQRGNTKPHGMLEEDSPTILNLIEQLNRDQEETRRNDSRVK